MTDANEGGDVGGVPVHVIQADDPAAAAEAHARELQADLAADLASAERLVRVRVDAGRRALVPPGADDAELLPRAEEIRRDAAIEPAIGDADVAELERLAADLARAARIRARTEARFTETLQAKLAASAGVALHPGAIKEAGHAVVAAEESLATAEQALVDHGPRPLPEGDASRTEAAPHWSDGAAAEPPAAGDAPEDAHPEDPVLRRPLDDFDEAALDRRRALTRGAAVFLVLVGLAVIALGLEQPPAASIVLAASGLVLGVGIVVKGRRAATLLAGDKAHSAAILAGLPDAAGRGATAAEPADQPEPEPEPEPVFTPMPVDEPSAAPEPELDPDADPWLDERVALDAARDEAEEQVRTARRRWHQLAGVDADPYDTDAVVRAHDPQLAFDARIAEASPTVRTVAAFHRKAQARWRVLWNAIGHDDPPDADDLDAVLEALLGDHRRRQADLRRLVDAEARAAAEAEARTPLVLVEPATWVSPARLAQLLSSIPPQGEVLVVERTGSTS
jgi:hypothetical protein